jgi:lysophospholipase L1-like esterase
MLHKPIHTLLFLISTLALLALLSFGFPKEGINAGPLSLSFPSLNSFFETEEKINKPDISKILALADAQDKIEPDKKDTTSLIKKDTVNMAVGDSMITIYNAKPVETVELDPALALITSIQYKSTDKSAMHHFFSSLKNLDSESKSIRILHYGDSQIEGDRISDYLRLKLQNQYGGEGPGLISLVPIAPSVINRISYSSGWDRYGVFSFKDKRVPHSNFGVMAQLCRYTGYPSAGDTTTKTATVKVVTTKNGGPKAAAYNKIKMFYGGAKSKVLCEFYDGGIFKESDSLLKGGNFNIKEYTVSSLIHEFKFSGKDSPDFYAVSLEGGKGVMVDNMGLRGSSGTFFNQINYSQLKQFYDYLNVKLIILQFGGNTLPYLKDKQMADNFGGYLKSQIHTLKKIAPNASILLIGPADMSIKQGTEYVTHPLLEDLRNAIRNAAFDTGCAFFDMYDCMGGKNSMVSWVEQGIAAKDYIHFSPQGARKIATLLYSSLMNDYNAYLKSGK